MNITIIAVRAGINDTPDPQITVSGDTVTVAGQAFDFSEVTDTADAGEPFVGPVTRQGGVIHCAIRTTYTTETAEADQPSDPAHWQVDVASGSVPDLVVRRDAAAD